MAIANDNPGPKSQSTPGGVVNASFERSLYGYCKELLEAEIARKERIEKKAHFYVTILTALVGAIFLKHDFLIYLAQELKGKSVESTIVTATYVFLFLLAALVVIGLIAIIGAMFVRQYFPGYPRKLYDSLFIASSMAFEVGNEVGFFQYAAKNYAIAVERFGAKNRKKAAWLQWASYSVIGAVAALAGLLACMLVISID